MQFKFDLEGRNKYSYKEYREMLDKLMADGLTTGNHESDEMIDATKSSIVKMNRSDKLTKLNDRLKSAILKAPKQRWIVLIEGWSSDSAQNLPVISKMADFAFNIEMHIMLRDENLDIMDAFLTKKARSIPKLISIDDNNKVLFTWGPRPEKMQERALEMKKAKEEFGLEIQQLYAKDRTVSIQAEFIKQLSALK
jgi:hypothetical protein